VTVKAELFIDCRCELGEGPLWNPLLQRLFWFDILNQTLFSADTSGHIVDRFTFKDVVSAAAIIDRDTLVVAQAGALLKFDIATDTSTVLSPIEEDLPGNRTNDGRANPAGGFWIGTMSRRGGSDVGAGALYQYRAGQLETILEDVSVPNSICFSPDGRTAYFADTRTKQIRKCALDPETGLPSGAWEGFASTEGLGSPDGAVVDAEGYLWSARWGGSAVVRHAPDGSVDRIIELPVSRVTCPALGGADLRTLYITTAREGMTPEELEQEPFAGSIFAVQVDVPGQPEPVLKL
jgi:sugar lactone lactonase YvrE